MRSKEENGLVKEKMPPRNVPHSQNILHVLAINNSGGSVGCVSRFNAFVSK